MEHINTFTNPDHKSAVRTFGNALTLGDSEAWLGAIRVFEARLTDHELAAASYALLKAQCPDNVALITDAVLGHKDTPLPPLLSEMDEATFWADIADPGYIKACVLAGYNRMPVRDQAAFIEYVQGRAAA
ncbi:MAG: hypothetical protein ABJI96_00465 [Paracoccaceae bacterium]